jgi:hypothetical protein
MSYDFEYRDDPVDEELFANVLLYGPVKSGKTTGATTAPGKKLLINADLSNATRYARRQHSDVLEPTAWKAKATDDNPTPVFDLMTAVVHGSNAREWDTVIIDPLGEFYRRLLTEQARGHRRPTLEQRGNATSDLERWLYAMCEAPVNFVIVAHEMAEVRGDEGLIFMPFTGSKTGSQSGLGPKVGGMVDVIGYTAVHELEDDPDPHYAAQLISGKGRTGGDRFDVLGPFRDVNLSEWFELAGVHMTTTNEGATP